jgi:hypothetical protein
MMKMPLGERVEAGMALAGHVEAKANSNAYLHKVASRLPWHHTGCRLTINHHPPSSHTSAAPAAPAVVVADCRARITTAAGPRDVVKAAFVVPQSGSPAKIALLNVYAGKVGVRVVTHSKRKTAFHEGVNLELLTS